MTGILKKLDSVREQIAALQAQHDEPINNLKSRAELADEIRGRIDLWHAEAAGKVVASLEEGHARDLLEWGGHPDPHGAARSLANETRAWLTFALGKEGMFARFKEVLDRMPEGLSAEGRAKARAEIHAKIAALEIKEEQIVRESDAQGVEWTPRDGQRPEVAILIDEGEDV